MRGAWFVLAVSALMACGTTPSGSDGGRKDAGVADGGTRADGGPGPGTDAGIVDAGPPPPPPRTAMGEFTANGVHYDVWTGFGALTARTHSIRFGSIETGNPRINVNFSVSNTGTAFACSMTETTFSAQYIVDGKIAFFTRNMTCDIALTQIPAAVDGEYVGTFSGHMDHEPRSVLDAGFPTLTITSGSFRVKRSN